MNRYGTILDDEMYKSTKLLHFFAQNCVCWSACVNSSSLVKTTLTFGVLNHNKETKKLFYVSFYYNDFH